MGEPEPDRRTERAGPCDGCAGWIASSRFTTRGWAWERHVLFVPKEPIPSLRRVHPEQVPRVRRLVALALAVATREGFGPVGFALLATGGAYQEVAQLHLHLASRARDVWYECPDRPAGAALLEAHGLTSDRHPRPPLTCIPTP